MAVYMEIERCKTNTCQEKRNTPPGNEVAKAQYLFVFLLKRESARVCVSEQQNI